MQVADGKATLCFECSAKVGKATQLICASAGSTASVSAQEQEELDLPSGAMEDEEDDHNDDTVSNDETLLVIALIVASLVCCVLVLIFCKRRKGANEEGQEVATLQVKTPGAQVVVETASRYATGDEDKQLVLPLQGQRRLLLPPLQGQSQQQDRPAAKMPV